MARNIAQIENLIKKLKQEADTLKSKEREGALAHVLETVARYGITRQEVFSGRESSNARSPMGSGDTGAPRRKSKPRTSRPAKYADNQGNTWSGRGKRPHWLTHLLAEGKTLEDFLIK
jgi:DNA-binding protein H-NS